MKDEGDDGRALHEIHPVLRQPVEGLQEQQQHEQGHELGRKIVPGDIEKNITEQQTKDFFFSVPVSVLRIWSVYPGSRIRNFPPRIPDKKKHPIPYPDQKQQI